jgi:hypothetical protein
MVRGAGGSPDHSKPAAMNFQEAWQIAVALLLYKHSRIGRVASPPLLDVKLLCRKEAKMVIPDNKDFHFPNLSHKQGIGKPVSLRCNDGNCSDL